MDDSAVNAEILRRLEVVERRLNIAPQKASSEEFTVKQNDHALNFPASEKKSLKFTSSSILAFTGFLCLFLAAVFVVLAAINLGWLTPLRQCLGAAILGAAFIWGGFLLKEKDNDFASYLPAAGICSLFAAIYGAEFLYQLLSPSKATVLAGGVSFLSIYLFSVFRSDLFTLLAALGSYSIPFLFTDSNVHFEHTALYFLGWSTTFAVLSVFVQSRSLTIISSYLGIGLFAFLSLERSDVAMIVAFTQLSQFLVLFLGSVSYSIIHKTALTESESRHLLPALLFFYCSEFLSLQEINVAVAPYCMVMIAALLLFTFIIAKRFLGELQGSRPLIEVFSLVTFIHSVYLQILPENLKPIVLVLLLVASIIQQSRDSSSLFSSAYTQFALYLIAVIEYGSVLSHLVVEKPKFDPNFLLYILYGAVLSFLFITKGRFISIAKKGSFGTLHFLLGHTLGMASVYGMLSQFHSYVVTLGWIVFGGVILAVGSLDRLKTLSKSSVFILLFAFLKLFLFDVSEADDLIRFISFLMVGIALYGSAWILRKIEIQEEG